MKVFLRYLSILVISSLVAVAGAWASLYYLGYRLGDSKVFKALQWEPLIVMASIWFVANLLVVYLLGRRGASEAAIVSPLLSEAAIADMHSDGERKTKPVKSLKARKEQANKSQKNSNSENNNKKERPEQPGKSKGSIKSEGPAKLKVTPKSDKSRKEKIEQEKNITTAINSKKKPRKKGGEVVTGIIKWFNGQKGYGFITSEEGEEVFVHCRSIKLGGKRQLHTGQQVSFTLLREDKGLKAEEVVILE